MRFRRRNLPIIWPSEEMVVRRSSSLGKTPNLGEFWP
jgi:hypothetical protein